ncbi:MAG: hypothetical protein JO355_13695 [Planctomycetaceae bacterium]|nr:hypothetical protein [Planctomycetaceae bacterium]
MSDHLVEEFDPNEALELFGRLFGEIDRHYYAMSHGENPWEGEGRSRVDWTEALSKACRALGLDHIDLDEASYAAFQDPYMTGFFANACLPLPIEPEVAARMLRKHFNSRGLAELVRLLTSPEARDGHPPHNKKLIS